MKALVTYLKGKKTYIIATAIAVLGLLQGLEVFIVPNTAWAVLAALGMSTMRAGVDKVAEEIKK